MNSNEIIKAVREIAADMSIRGSAPGVVSESLRSRALDLLVKAGVPFGPWRDGRTIHQKQGVAIVNNREQPFMVHKSTHDTSEVEIVNAIASWLLVVVNWKALSFGMVEGYQGWDAERAEQAIVEGSKVIPELCDRLENVSSGDPKDDWIMVHADDFNVSRTTLSNWRKKEPEGFRSEAMPLSPGQKKKDVRYKYWVQKRCLKKYLQSSVANEILVNQKSSLSKL